MQRYQYALYKQASSCALGEPTCLVQQEKQPMSISRVKCCASRGAGVHATLRRHVWQRCEYPVANAAPSIAICVRIVAAHPRTPIYCTERRPFSQHGPCYVIHSMRYA
eukprot:6184839-Pleurochrysis_carterae.AAC.4